MTCEIGFALVGCGEIGLRNAQSIAEAQGARLVRVVDVDQEQSGPVAGRYGVPQSGSLDDALSDPGVEAVFIATPHHLHGSMSIEAAEAGRHVIVEKPIATTMPDAEAAVEACRAAGVSLSCCHPRCYEPKIVCARRVVEQQLVGRILLTASVFLKEKTAEYWQDGPWRGCRAESGGGVLMMNLIHHLDALHVITANPIRTAVALTSGQRTDVEVEDTAAVALGFESGALGTIAACSSLPGPKVFEDAVYGDRGRVIVQKRAVRLFTSRPSSYGPPNQWAVLEFEEDRVSKKRFVEEFAASVRCETQPPVNAAYGLALLRLVLGAYEHSDADAARQRMSSQEVQR